MINQERLKELLHYDPETGMFIWCVKPSRRVKSGAAAGGIDSKRYRVIRIDGVYYKAHRLAWLYVHGRFPIRDIDHINGVRDDNRIANLREATRAENGQNRKKNINNTSGFHGVSWDSANRKWRASIQVNSRPKRLGLFDAPESAHAAYLAAKAELHTFNPRIRNC